MENELVSIIASTLAVLFFVSIVIYVFIKILTDLNNRNYNEFL